MTIQDALSGGLQLPISPSCQVLEVSRSGYYKWRKQPGIAPFVNSEYVALKDQIQEIALEFPGYGYRRITAELQHRGYAVNHKRVLRLMRQDNLLCLKKKFKPVTTDSSHGLPVYPNLLKIFLTSVRKSSDEVGTAPRSLDRIRFGLRLSHKFSCYMSISTWQ